MARSLRHALGEHALVLTPDDLDGRGLLAATPVVRDRIGAVVALATTPNSRARRHRGLGTRIDLRRRDARTTRRLEPPLATVLP